MLPRLGKLLHQTDYSVQEFVDHPIPHKTVGRSEMQTRGIRGPIAHLQRPDPGIELLRRQFIAQTRGTLPPNGFRQNNPPK
ncbi:hypothetical protein MNKW57_03660 [Biformimicrobium ophioploci]|uniref:Uncharacterized protein n=1 Tax=Biformimicrobium ophioploci TaxID=3036711 RepID=A0ABQ6LVE5_9GAMM|nr:hypothetical protein MNKW57_03660 [Microbulbifer sp. NKW57]